MRGYRLLFGMMAWGTVSIASAAALTPAQQAFADAQALAAGAQAGAAANVSGGSVATTVNQFNPTYYNSSGTAPETALFQNGNGNTVSAGQTKVADCQNNAPNPDPFLRQNCEAIKLMVNNPSNRPVIAIPPSTFASSKAIVANANTLAATSLGIANPNTGGAFSGCVNKTVGPAPITKICNEFNGTAAQQCTVGRVVVVDEFTNYKCDKTVDTYLPQTCDRTVVVTVTQPPPIAATRVGGKWVVVGGGPPFSLNCPTNNSSMTWNNSAVYTYLNWQCNGVGCWNGVITQNVCPWDYSCPAGTTRSGVSCVLPPVFTSSINNGCTVQEAAAL